jgi:hypothetical protein
MMQSKQTWLYGILILAIILTAFMSGCVTQNTYDESVPESGIYSAIKE